MVIGYQCGADLGARLLKAFEGTHGEVVEGSWRHDLHAAAVLTKGNDLHIWCNLRLLPLYFAPVMQRISAAYEDCRSVSGPSDVACALRASRIAFDALSIIPSPQEGKDKAAASEGRRQNKVPSAPGDTLDRLRVLDIALERFEFTFKGRALSFVVGHFFRGLVSAALALLLLAFGIYEVGLRFQPNTATAWFAMVIAAGSIGSLTSAVYRYLTNELSLDYLAGKSAMWQGVLHAFLGAVFGAIAGSLVQSGLLQGFIQPGNKTADYFYIVVAFAGGFLERLVPDNLERMTRRTSGPASPKARHQAI